MRLLTDFRIALTVATVVWCLWYFGPIFLDTLLDPFRDRFTDVDELAASDRNSGDARQGLLKPRHLHDPERAGIPTNPSGRPSG